ncbi:MAG: 4Fe-4S dicluster domain-containing protein [Anaerolineales bacterium]|nr:4Fe-4S dicluster domain-containing protein [Anaerolineales bacterium]MCL4261370.1 4Fe-4S dicluster domain-containing protein [Anaerolineales bacterium]
MDRTAYCTMAILGLFQHDVKKHAVLASGLVAPNPARCVQCGICTFNCPVGIDVRAHAWRGEPVIHNHCLTCGECVMRCPRGSLRFEKTDLFAKRKP